MGGEPQEVVEGSEGVAQETGEMAKEIAVLLVETVRKVEYGGSRGRGAEMDDVTTESGESEGFVLSLREQPEDVEGI